MKNVLPPEYPAFFPKFQKEYFRGFVDISYLICERRAFSRLVYGIQVGDIIEFPSSSSSLLIANFSTVIEGYLRFGYIIGVTRNNRLGWLSLSSLCQLSYGYKYPSCPFVYQMNMCFDYAEMVNMLLGKSIVCTGTREMHCEYYSRYEGLVYTSRKFPIIEWKEDYEKYKIEGFPDYKKYYQKIDSEWGGFHRPYLNGEFY